MILASFTTYHFQFDGLFETKDQARREMIAAWKRHTKDGGDPDYIQADDVRYSEIEVGQVLRDGDVV